MGENENLERLNKIKSVVSSRDMEIWENVAHTMCIQKETEKLRSETIRMVKETESIKKENKTMEEQLAALTKSLDIERETLGASERSTVLQKSLNESLFKEAEEMKKKYDKTLAEYNNELQDYRRMYEKNSKGYQDLRKQEIEIKKLEIEKKVIEGRIKDLENSEKQYMEIQKKRFTSTMVKFAEFYTLYHKNENLKAQVKETKKVEQELLKEHFELTEAVKQKKKLGQSRTTSNSISQTENFESKDREPKDKKQLDADMVRKFLDEEMLPFSLTTIDSSQKIMKFNQDKSKIKVLDTKIIPPPSPLPQNKKPAIDVAKKIENAMKTAKQNIARSGSFQVDLLGFKRKILKASQGSLPGSQNSQAVSQPEKCDSSRPKTSESQIQHFGSQSNPSGSVSKLSGSQAQSQHQETQVETSRSQVHQSKFQPRPSGSRFHQSGSQPRPSGSQFHQSGSQPRPSGSQFKRPISQIKPALQPIPFGSQFQNFGSHPRPTIDRKVTPTSQVFAEQIAKNDIQTGLQQGERKQTSCKYEVTAHNTMGENSQISQEKVTNSILKPPSQEKTDNVSKFFNQKKKTVTFENQPKKDEVTKFELFTHEEKVDNGIVVNDINVFPGQFFFNNDGPNQAGNNLPSAAVPLPENASESHIDSFTMETGATNFGTYGEESAGISSPDGLFNFQEPVSNPSFGFGPLNSGAQEPETTGFNFLASQNNLNPFGF